MDASAATIETELVRDPVCGMIVDPSAGKPRHEHDGHTYHFCSQGCRAKFIANPEAYIAATDPVCGMKVDRSSAKHTAAHAGETHYFCSEHCKSRFKAAPQDYLGGKTASEPVPEGTIYTCPMHPEIRQVGPGSCPICGMGLEPVLVSLEAEPNLELIDMRRRFWVGLALTIPVVILEMGVHFFGLHHYISLRTSNWLQLVFATPAVLWAGWPFFRRGWQSLLNRSLNMFTLIAMGTGAAWIYSTVATLAPGIFPDAFRQPDGSV
ncbi:MAG: YHS domain-containing protein, partial [Burkholderiaceae bacterium]|nr:YHS domain-containing protein [Burkholderiaceae bacterium]